MCLLLSLAPKAPFTFLKDVNINAIHTILVQEVLEPVILRISYTITSELCRQDLTHQGVTDCLMPRNSLP